MFALVTIGASSTDTRAIRATSQPAPTQVKQVITLTPQAAAEVKKVASEQQMVEYWLRVGVKHDPGTDRYEYVLDVITDKPDAKDDIVQESQGVRIVVDYRSSIFLTGCEIDYRDNEKGRGFIFQNPNAK